MKILLVIAGIKQEELIFPKDGAGYILTWKKMDICINGRKSPLK